MIVIGEAALKLCLPMAIAPLPSLELKLINSKVICFGPWLLKSDLFCRKIFLFWMTG